MGIRLQALISLDFSSTYCVLSMFLQTLVQIPELLALILSTDEAKFLKKLKNVHNNHVWTEENPHEVREDRFQHLFSLNVWWVGILDGWLLYFFSTWSFEVVSLHDSSEKGRGFEKSDS